MDTPKQIRFRRRRELKELRNQLCDAWDYCNRNGLGKAKAEINESIIKIDESLEQMEEEETFENSWNDYHSKY